MEILPEFIKDKYITTEATIKQFNQEAFELGEKVEEPKKKNQRKKMQNILWNKKKYQHILNVKNLLWKVRYFSQKETKK